jgi:ubiquinone/menaquinone biosynthesis C-methylase UbiE
MILDVGCGSNPKGDLNLDRYRITREEGAQNRQTKTKADIIATGECLPFQDNAFDIVRSDQCIEHSTKPKLFLDECIRVARRQVFIRCPHHQSPYSAKRPYHRSYFDVEWFRYNANGSIKIWVDMEALFPPRLFHYRYIRWLVRKTIGKMIKVGDQINVLIFK